MKNREARISDFKKIYDNQFSELEVRGVLEVLLNRIPIEDLLELIKGVSNE